MTDHQYIGISTRKTSNYDTPWESWRHEGGKFVRWIFDENNKPKAIWKDKPVLQ